MSDRQARRKRWRRLPAARAQAETEARTEQPSTVESEPRAPMGTLDAKAVAAVATALWRMRNKMVVPGTDRPPPELRGLFRHLESAWDALGDTGIEVQSHDGLATDPGLALSVVAYQPTAGLDCDRVLETIRPSVYLHGRTIQQGEVVVGTPLDETAEDSPA